MRGNVVLIVENVPERMGTVNGAVIDKLATSKCHHVHTRRRHTQWQSALCVAFRYAIG